MYCPVDLAEHRRLYRLEFYWYLNILSHLDWGRGLFSVHRRGEIGTSDWCNCSASHSYIFNSIHSSMYSSSSWCRHRGLLLPWRSTSWYRTTLRCRPRNEHCIVMLSSGAGMSHRKQLSLWQACMRSRLRWSPC